MEPMSESSQIRVAVRPPEYFPRLEYFVLMQSVDVFIVADTFQYSRQSFQNRTPIRTPAGRLWLSIPLVGGQHKRRISDVAVAGETERWQRKHWRSLEFNYRSTPYFEFLEAEISEVLSPGSTGLGQYTVASTFCIRDLLEVRTKVVRASAIAGRPCTVPDIIRALGGDELVVLEDTFEADLDAAPRVTALKPRIQQYRQNFEGFEPGLSALDAVFNVGPVETRKLLRCG